MTELSQRLRELDAELAELSLKAYEAWHAIFRGPPSEPTFRKGLRKELEATEAEIETLETERKLVDRALTYSLRKLVAGTRAGRDQLSDFGLSQREPPVTAIDEPKLEEPGNMEGSASTEPKRRGRRRAEA